MIFSADTFLTHVKNIVTGGGRTGGQALHDAGFLKRAEGVTLASMHGTASMASLIDSTGATPSQTAIVNLADGSTYATDHAAIEANFATLALKVNSMLNFLSMTADETNARVIKVEEDVNTVGNIVFPIPRDYDEATDELRLRVLVSQILTATDDDVKLDVELYRKRAGDALSADLAPAFTADSAVPVLSTTEQWIEFDLSQLDFLRDDVAIIELITNGLNDTAGDEVLIHAIELVYRSTLVSYDDEEDAQGNTLR